MVDLGVYNFVKNAVAAGKSTEDITADLTRGGQSPDTIEEALAAVHAGKPPAVRSATPTPVNIGIASRAPGERVQQIRGVALVLKLALLFALIGVAAFYLGPRLKDLQAGFQEVREKYEAGRMHVPGEPTPPASTK